MIVPISGMRDLEVGQHLQQERLELVVGPVDLVDEQDRPVAGADRLEQRPLEQELRAEQLVDRGVVVESGARTAPGSAASGARSPTRTAPGWCRCPRSTAAGSACARTRSRAPWRPRSCRRRPRPRAGSDGPATARRTARWPARGRPGSRRRAGSRSAQRRSPDGPSASPAAVDVSAPQSRRRPARGRGRGCCRPTVLSLPSRRSWSRQAARRSVPGSAKPSKLTSFMFRQHLVGPQSSSRSALVCAVGRPHRAQHLDRLIRLVGHGDIPSRRARRTYPQL